MTGPINAYTSVMCGHLTLTISDADGNIKTVYRQHNVIASLAKRKMAEAMFQGSAGVRAIYAYIVSGDGTTGTSLSMTLACSGAHPSIGVFTANQPVTLNYNWNSDLGWSLTGSMTYSNTGPASINGIALCYQPATAPAAASICLTGWFAAAHFAEWVPSSNNILTIVWVFSLSTTTSTVI